MAIDNVLRRKLYLLDPKKKKLFDQIFTRHEAKSSPFYLYETAEAVQTQFQLLIDSEIGYLFDTTKNLEELDLMELSANGEIAYISLNGLIYSKFIKTLAHFIISDINYLFFERYMISNDFPFFSIFDEPSSYLSADFIDTVNKTRGAGNHAIFSPQTLADIETIDKVLLKQLIGNVNTFVIGKLNEKDEIDYLAKLFGTYDDIEVTNMLEQGYADAGKMDWVGGRGTGREIDPFHVNPNTIRGLRKGEFIVYRTAAEVRTPIRKVYFRKVI